jgi:hypothetical protein
LAGEYNRQEEKVVEELKISVEKALALCLTDNTFRSLAYQDVLRYMKIGLLRPRAITETSILEDIFSWYPRNMDYLVLRWASKGMLEFVYQKK